MSITSAPATRMPISNDHSVAVAEQLATRSRLVVEVGEVVSRIREQTVLGGSEWFRRRTTDHADDVVAPLEQQLGVERPVRPVTNVLRPAPLAARTRLTGL